YISMVRRRRGPGRDLVPSAHSDRERNAVNEPTADVDRPRDARVTPLRVSPQVGPRGTIILPQILLNELTPTQIALIIQHERCHIRRHDPAYFLLLAIIDAAFWLNPFIRQQTARCRLAAELAVDAMVATGDDAPRRQVYAAGLVAALKHTAVKTAPSAASAASHKGDYIVRIDQILHPKRPRARRLGLVALFALAIPVAAAQWAYADPQTPEKVAFTAVPLNGEITSHFGRKPSKKNGRSQNHRGVDIKAAEGTPIVAPAVGWVAEIGRNLKGYGNLLTIKHAGGFVTRYAHLSAFDVKVGDRVWPGDTIARVGNTGRSTGPHLHFEVMRDGEYVDPAAWVPMPE
ncbi:MAG: peptidoglycan DD-metalloendopeptidase family protein, partial [Myxococcota bacterium]